jgi:tetratricopeptide (TPR) repeat protein
MNAMMKMTTSLSGVNGLIERTRVMMTRIKITGIKIAGIQPAGILGVAFALFLAGCAHQAPAPVETRSPDVETTVREPAVEESKGVQVYSLQNPAVKQLVAQAKTAESDGNLDQASGLIERALRIQPQDPQLLQQMAEIKLQESDYQQALNFASRSYESGPRVGEICSRNWRTISVAKDRLQDMNGSTEAAARAKQCMNTRPEKL